MIAEYQIKNGNFLSMNLYRTSQALFYKKGQIILEASCLHMEQELVKSEEGC